MQLRGAKLNLSLVVNSDADYGLKISHHLSAGMLMLLGYQLHNIVMSSISMLAEAICVDNIAMRLLLGEKLRIFEFALQDGYSTSS